MQSLNGLGHYNYEGLHELQNITIPFYDCNGKIIFVRDEIHAKNVQKHLLRPWQLQDYITGSWFFPGANYVLKHGTRFSGMVWFALICPSLLEWKG